MSNTIVRDCTPNDNGIESLVVVIGEDGSLSVDPETLKSYYSKEGNSARVSIIRMSSSDPESNCVNATLDTFIDTNMNSNHPVSDPSVEIKRTIMDELSVDVDELTRMCRNIQMDHDYTPLTSPSEKLPSKDFNLNRTGGDLIQSQNINKSTEDLMAVLESDTESTPIDELQQPVKLSELKKAVVNVERLSNKNESSEKTPQTVNKNAGDSNQTQKKSIKIVSVTKTSSGARSAQNVIKENTKAENLQSPKELEKVYTDNELKYDDDLSDISSDSDFEMDDDSEDSDFDAGRQKISKPKYKTFGSKKNKSNLNKSKKDKSNVKSSNRPSIPLKNKKPSNLSVKDLEKTPFKIKSNKLKLKSTLSSSSPPVPVIEKVEPPPQIAGETPEKHDPNKKTKKKVVKPPGFIDDGIALFSTPDVMRRVSVSGKSDSGESSTKLEGKISRVSSIDQIDSSTPVKDVTDLHKNDLFKLDTKSITEPASITDSTLDNTNLDLDLNTDELIPEDLLFQVAKLVENADIQKVIDTNLSLVDQNLSNLDSVLPKSVVSDSFSSNEYINSQTSMPTTKELESIMSENDNSISLTDRKSDISQSANTPSGLITVGGKISANTTNKPIQIVRPDGRVIIIPPIEKPATRSSKRKQVGDDSNNSPITSTPVSTKVAPITEPNINDTIPVTATIQQSSDSSTETNKLSQVKNVEEAEKDEMDDSDSDESWKSEDDPDRLWCICKQPHNNRFMICCDTCEEWFHGQCVGVSKALGRQMEQQGKEWQCPNCVKAKKNALQQALNEAQATMTLSPPPNSQNDQADGGKPTQRCIVCKGPSRSGSVYCSEQCIVQHSTAVERVIVFERATGKCLSGSNAPTVANLKQWLKQHPGFEVVSSGNKTLTQSKLHNKGGKLSLQQNIKIVPKSHNPNVKQQSATINPETNKIIQQKTQLNFYGKQNSPNVLNKNLVSVSAKNQQTKLNQQSHVKATKLTQPHVIPSKTAQAKPKTPTTPNTPTSQQIPKLVNSQEDLVVKKKTPTNKSASTPQKITSRQKSLSTTPDEKAQKNTKAPEQLRENVRKTLAEHFTARLKEQTEIKMSDEEVKSLSMEIEAELYSLFNKDTGAKYRNRYRSLIFNIKDSKNQTLWKRICEKSVSPKQLVRLSPEELASQELAQWRERETKHQLDMIKKTELDLLSCVRTYVLKSHKGEEVIEKRVEAVDSTIVADLDSSINEERQADSTSERNVGSSLDNSKDLFLNKSFDDKNKYRKDSGSSSSKHKTSREKSKERNSRKHHDSSRDKKRRSRSRERKRDSSKDHKSSESKKRHRSRSGSRGHKSDDRDKSRHKHDHSRHKSSSSRHKHSRHKDSESDSNSNTKHSSKEPNNKTENRDLLTGLDKKSKEILESLVDNKVVDDQILKKNIELTPSRSAPPDSESDHEPSSTVIIATPPRSTEADSIPIEKPTPVPRDSINMESPQEENALNVSENTEKRIIGTLSSKQLPLPPKSMTSVDGPIVWKGFISMVDVAKFKITAQEVSGDCSGLTTELPSSLDIVGRISPDTVWEYLSKMRRSTAKYISILRLMPENYDEQTAYQSLYTYLNSRKRFGVVKTTNTNIKDFYIMPQASYNPLPQVLLPLNGPGFEEARPNLLLGILVSSKRKRSQIYETTPVPIKKAKESSPPRSYTPPPTKDLRIIQRPNLVSSISMPPLPTVAPIPPPDLPKPEPPPLDDLDEPYSPGDSDDALPSIPVNIVSSKSKPSIPADEKEKQKAVITESTTKSNLSILEPFKTSNYSSIPGLDTANLVADKSNVSSLLSSTVIPKINLDSNTIVDNLTPEINDLDALQRNIDEINKRIERERKEIDSISMGIVQKDDLESSCLANIALPSNLQQILDSIKTTKKSDEVDPTEIPMPPKTNNFEEYQPKTLTSTASFNASGFKESSTLDDTIPLLLPKIPRSSLESKTSLLPDLHIPLNLPISKRTVNLSPGVKRSLNDTHELSDNKRKSVKSEKDSEIGQIPLQIPFKKASSSITRASDSSHSSPSKDSAKELLSENFAGKSSSVLSSLTPEDLIRKANEMLAEQNIEKEQIEDDDDDNDDDNDNVDVNSKTMSIKQAPVLYPTVPPPKINHRFISNLEQPPVPGTEDFE